MEIEERVERVERCARGCRCIRRGYGLGCKGYVRMRVWSEELNVWSASEAAHCLLLVACCVLVACCLFALFPRPFSFALSFCLLYFTSPVVHRPPLSIYRTDSPVHPRVPRTPTPFLASLPSYPHRHLPSSTTTTTTDGHARTHARTHTHAAGVPKSVIAYPRTGSRLLRCLRPPRRANHPLSADA